MSQEYVARAIEGLEREADWDEVSLSCWHAGVLDFKDPVTGQPGIILRIVFDDDEQRKEFAKEFFKPF